MHGRRKRDHVITRKEFTAEVGVLMGGRAAEQIVFSDVSGGAQNDLFRATLIAREMVERLGMSDELGPTTFFAMAEEGERMVRRRASDATEQRIDEEVEKLLKAEMDRVVALLVTHRAVLDEMTETVIGKRILEKEDIRAFLEKRGFKVDWPDDESVAAASIEVKPNTAAPPSKAEGGRRS